MGVTSQDLDIISHLAYTEFSNVAKGGGFWVVGPYAGKQTIVSQIFPASIPIFSSALQCFFYPLHLTHTICHSNLCSEQDWETTETCALK